MKSGAIACILLGTVSLILGLLRGFDVVLVGIAAVVGLCWLITALLNGPASFHGLFFSLTSAFAGFLAGFGANPLGAAAALSFALGAWDLCMTAPRLTPYAAHQRTRFVRGYLVRSTTWLVLGFLLVWFSYAPRQKSQSIYVLIALAILTFVVILFLLWRIRMLFAGESPEAQEENG